MPKKVAKGPKSLFGQELEKLWLNAGFKNRNAFLKASGLENTTVNRWEYNPNNNPRDEQLQQAANALKVSFEFLKALQRRSLGQLAKEGTVAVRGSSVGYSAGVAKIEGVVAEPAVEYELDDHDPARNARAMKLELRVRDHFDDAGESLSPEEKLRVRMRAVVMAGRFGDDAVFQDLVDLVVAWRNRESKAAPSMNEQSAAAELAAATTLTEEDKAAGIVVLGVSMAATPMRGPMKVVPDVKKRRRKSSNDDDKGG